MKRTTLNKVPQDRLSIVKKYLPNIRTRKCMFSVSEDKRYHFVYCILNLVNGKFYLGKHTTKSLKRNRIDYSGSGVAINNAYSKYGKENFVMLILKFFKTAKEAFDYEIKIISEQMIKSLECYNYQGGGKGWATGKLHHIHLKTELGINPGQRRPDGTSMQMDRVNAGIHHLLKRKDGTSHASERVANGWIPPWIGKKPWKCNAATASSLLAWYMARRIHKEYIRTKRGALFILKRIENKIDVLSKYGTKLNINSVDKVLRRLRDGWYPNDDSDWLEFRTAFFTQK